MTGGESRGKFEGNSQDESSRVNKALCSAGPQGAALFSASLVAIALLSSACTSTRSHTTIPTATSVQSTAAGSKGESYSDPALGFELDQPPGEGWALATGVSSPEGRDIPVVVAHPESGAQIVIQVSSPESSPKNLAYMLKTRLEVELPMNISDPEPLAMESGGDAYGFAFVMTGEAAGRVAVIQVGDQMVLVVASWPEDASNDIVSDIDSVVRSVRQPQGEAAKVFRRDRI